MLFYQKNKLVKPQRTNNKMQTFFILSCARSGSTSLSKILDKAKNGVCALEPEPNLNFETRQIMEGRLSDPRALLKETILKRVMENSKRTMIYGEKNVTYGPFVPYLYEMCGCKFVFLKRDGRDVVRSMMDWHERMFGSIYRECKDPGKLSPLAISAAASLPVHLDTSDYARPRPLPGNPFYDEWDNFSREEMCTFYWSHINEQYLNHLEKLPRESWIEIDYTSANADEVLQVAKFLGLEGLSKRAVLRMLNKRINSLKERIGEEQKYPDWKNWDGGLRRRFDRIAGKTMQRLGYYLGDGSEWRPWNYGLFWRTKPADLEWYTWMYEGRIKAHTDLNEWVHSIDNKGEPIEKIADFGCGLGVGYCDHFENKHYTGIDLSPNNIEWCKKHRKNPRHKYINVDFITERMDEKFDLVFSSGTIDNTYDIEEFLKSMVRNSKKWIYLTCYKGWFPELAEHKYSWNEEHGCYYNDISPRQVRHTLNNLGCKDILVQPIKTERKDITYETLIIARVPDA